MKQTFDICVVRFPYGGVLHDDVSDWLADTQVKMRLDPRIAHLRKFPINDTPVTMSRNRAVYEARNLKCDFLLMIDSDMSPDSELGAVPGAAPFWDSSFDFMVKHYPQGPCVVAAPYCGPAPEECVYVFRWRGHESHCPILRPTLDMYSREEAAVRSGFERAAALPTGLILYDLRAFERMTPPWFYYVFQDELPGHPGLQVKKAGTEDVMNTRDLSMLGVPQYVNWDAWAGHWKLKCVRKPQLVVLEHVSQAMRDAVLRDRRASEQLLVVGAEHERSAPNAPPIAQPGFTRYVGWEE